MIVRLPHMRPGMPPTVGWPSGGDGRARGGAGGGAVASVDNGRGHQWRSAVEDGRVSQCHGGGAAASPGGGGHLRP
jgi:hypothetical protein